MSLKGRSVSRGGRVGAGFDEETCQSGVNTLSHVTRPRPASAWALFSCI
jgi:hypothetical protein